MEINIYLYNGITALDVVGPYEVLTKLPNAKVKFVAERKGIIVSDSHFLKLVAEYEISEIEKADILLIPWSVIGFVREARNQNVKDWIKKIHLARKLTEVRVKKDMPIPEMAKHLPSILKLKRGR